MKDFLNGELFIMRDELYLFFNKIIRLFYYPITLVVYIQKKIQLKKTTKKYLNNTLHAVKNTVSMYYWDALAMINYSSYVKSIYKIHKQLTLKLKEEDIEKYNMYKYGSLSLITLDEIGLKKFAKAFQLPNGDRSIYVIGRITYFSAYTYTNEGKGSLHLQDEFGNIYVEITNSNIQYLLDYFFECKIKLIETKYFYEKNENNLATLHQKLGDDVNNFIVAVPLLIFAKNRQKKDFNDFEVGNNRSYHAAPDLPILLLSDTSNKYSAYALPQ